MKKNEINYCMKKKGGKYKRIRNYYGEREREDDA